MLSAAVVLVAPALTAAAGPASAISGGQTSAFLPAYNVLIESPRSPGVDNVCTGAIVARRWVLTAAHCVHQLTTDWWTGAEKLGDPIPASAFSLYLGGSVFGADTGSAYHVDQVHEEPVMRNTQGDLFNDIALLHLTSAAPDYLAPVPLAFSPATTPQGAPVVALGWGPTSTVGGGRLMQQTNPGDYTLDKTGCYSSGEVCYRRTANTSSYIQPGDSGGPWLTTLHGSDIQVGLTTGPGGNATQYGASTYGYRYWLRKYIPLPHAPAGTIVRDQDTGKAYLVDSDGFRRSIVDPDTYNCLVGQGVTVQNLDRYLLLAMPQDYDDNATCDANVGDGTGGTGGDAGPTQTNTTLTSSVNPSVYGQPVTFTASVDAPDGTVYFSSDDISLGAQPLSGGTASITATLPTGTHTITAYYGGTDGYTDSADTLTQTVDRAYTTTSIASSANPAVYCQTVRFSSTVAPIAPGAGTPTGQLTLSDGGSTAGTGNLDGSGNGYVDTQFFTIGHHPMVMSYGGDQNFYDSTSSALDQVVNKAPTLTTVTAAPASSNLFGRTSTFTAAVTVPPPGCGTPTGSVTFTVDGTAVQTFALDSADHAILSTTALLPGHHTINATYAGDSNFLGSNGSTSYLVTCSRILTGAVKGNVAASGESTCLVNAKLSGAVTVPAGVRFAAVNSSINGSIVSNTHGGGGMIAVCGTRITGTVDARNGQELVMVGDVPAACATNIVGGALILRFNQNGAEAIGNSVGTVQAAGNSGPGPYGQPTTITGNTPPAG
jgi:hypothetical protein